MHSFFSFFFFTLSLNGCHAVLKGFFCFVLCFSFWIVLLLLRKHSLLSPLDRKLDKDVFSSMRPRSKQFDQYATQLKWDVLKENDSQSNLCSFLFFFSVAASKPLTAF